MSWVDNIFNSSFIVWFIIGIGLFHLYLRKTGKTFLDVVHDIRDFFSGLTEDKDE